MGASRWRRWVTLGEGLLYLTPSLGLLSVFVFYPAIRSIYLSLYLTDSLGRPKLFHGLTNFTDSLTDASFLHSLWTSVLFVLYTVPGGIIVGLLLALLADRPLRGIRFFQTLFSSTMGVSVATGSLIWAMMYNPISGVLNYFLNVLHLPKVAWLTQPAWALPAVALVSIWIGLGFNFVLMLSGLQNVPQELREAARVDGANGWHQTRHIVLPLISPTLFFAAVVGVIRAFQTFGEVDILTSGGPSQATNIVVYQIYQRAFIDFNFGTASAQALILFVIIMLFTFLQFRLGERRVHYQ